MESLEQGQCNMVIMTLMTFVVSIFPSDESAVMRAMNYISFRADLCRLFIFDLMICCALLRSMTAVPILAKETNEMILCKKLVESDELWVSATCHDHWMCCLVDTSCKQTFHSIAQMQANKC